MILRHARKQIELKGEFVGIREMRKHVAWYTADASQRRTQKRVKHHRKL